MSEIILFRCERRAASLTIKACSGFYSKANTGKIEPYDTAYKCRACPIGAAHASGGAVPDKVSTAKADFQAAQDEWSNVCPRCRRQSTRIVGGKLCVSCYNRQREVKVGKNRKGNPPRELPKLLCSMTLEIADDNGVRLQTFENVTFFGECLIQIAKTATGPFSARRVFSEIELQEIEARRAAMDGEAGP